MNGATASQFPDPMRQDPMHTALARQRAAQLQEGPPGAPIRIDRLNRCIDILIKYEKQIIESLNTDFGNRSPAVTGMSEIYPSIAPLKHARAHLAGWMKPERRRTSPALLGFIGATAELRKQPKGVVGIMSPWNFPINLTFSPLAGVLAAGNRAMIKPSELTPATSDLLAQMIAEAFDATEITVILGGPEIGQAFSGLAFDHLVFTGATAIARHVMRAAAENLVPLTLELGGKSPAILGRSADLPTSVARIMSGKTLNAGQICLAPDYALVPTENLDGFVAAARQSVTAMFPTIKDNPDYTTIISDRHFDRLTGYVADARAKGAEIVELNPANEDFRQQQFRKIPPTLILHARDDMQVMQDEIFGPLLPVKTYDGIGEAIDYVNAHDRPLAVYYFGKDAGERDQVIGSTTSGGVTINDVIFHVGQENMPFGGIGPSGMGRYHGADGFREFSHQRAVYSQLKSDIGPLKMLRPPFGEKLAKYLASQLKR